MDFQWVFNVYNMLLKLDFFDFRLIGIHVQQPCALLYQQIKKRYVKAILLGNLNISFFYFYAYYGKATPIFQCLRRQIYSNFKFIIGLFIQPSVLRKTTPIQYRFFIQPSLFRKNASVFIEFNRHSFDLYRCEGE